MEPVNAEQAGERAAAEIFALSVGINAIVNILLKAGVMDSHEWVNTSLGVLEIQLKRLEAQMDTAGFAVVGKEERAAFYKRTREHALEMLSLGSLT